MRKAWLVLAVWLVGCAPQARAGLQFAALQATAATSGSRLGAWPQFDVAKPTFDYFKMRFLSVYLVEDRDATPPSTPRRCPSLPATTST